MPEEFFLGRGKGIVKKVVSVFVMLAIVTTLFVALPVNGATVGGPVVPANGQLKVVGTQLCNEYGEPVQLKGMSSMGLQWKGDYMNYDSIKWLRDDWGITVIRAAMYTAEKGYITDPSVKEKVKEIVNAATELGIYAIIDWHILSDGDPNTYKQQAKDFFKEMATLYAKNNNVIYELCNEPNKVTWSSVKNYANEVIPVIRAIDPDCVIVVGTTNWSQNVDEASKDPINASNIMYACHFYAGTHGQSLRDKINNAMNNGAAVFITEWGTSKSTGTGGVFPTQSDEWLNFLDSKKISWCNWSLCDKAETSAALVAGASTKGGWTAADLTQSGSYVKSKMPGSMKTSSPSPLPSPSLSPSPSQQNTPVNGCSISGYIAPDVTTNSVNEANSGFKIEIQGTNMSAITDGNGFFKIDNVLVNNNGYTIKVSKLNYLAREIGNVVINTSNVQLSQQSAPIYLWPGDIAINGSQNGAINLGDIMEVASKFNSSSGDGKYVKEYDFNLDDAINISDIIVIAKHFNKISADY